MENETFNIFNVLGKDDKELIHSAFIAFLFRENGEYINRILELPSTFSSQEYQVDTEVVYPGRQRIDIQIQFDNDVVAIENKFKSIPRKKQLDKYSKGLEEKWKKSGVKIWKYLFVFSKTALENKDTLKGWTVIDYSDILEKVRSIQKDFDHTDKYWFIQHYIRVLERYLDDYRDMHNNGINFNTHNGVGGDTDNNFWKRLLFSELAQRLESRRDIEKIRFDEGSTREPLIELFFTDNVWKPRYPENDIVFSIQFQGKYIKFYLHYNKNVFEQAKKIAEQLIEKIRKRGRDNFPGQLKNLPKKVRENKRDDSTFYIYKESIHDMLNTDRITSSELEEYINEFQEKVYGILTDNSYA